jgi:hypothetical protein
VGFVVSPIVAYLSGREYDGKESSWLLGGPGLRRKSYGVTQKGFRSCTLLTITSLERQDFTNVLHGLFKMSISAAASSYTVTQTFTRHISSDELFPAKIFIFRHVGCHHSCMQYSSCLQCCTRHCHAAQRGWVLRWRLNDQRDRRWLDSHKSSQPFGSLYIESQAL